MAVRVMNVLLCLWLLCGAVSPVRAEAKRPASAPARQYLDADGSVIYSLVDGYPLQDKDGKELAEVTLRVLSPVVPSDQRLQVEWTLSNIRQRGQYLNPGLHRRIVPTGELIFFDQDGRNMELPGKGGSFLAADWITLDPGERFTASSAEPLWFPPGRYRVQLVYWKRLLQPPPNSGLPPVAPTQPFGFREELFRSNPVWFEVVAPGRGPATQPAGGDEEGDSNARK